MNEFQNVISEAGESQPWWYVRAQLLILLTSLLLLAAGTYAVTPLLVRAF